MSYFSLQISSETDFGQVDSLINHSYMYVNNNTQNNISDAKILKVSKGYLL